MMRGIKKIWRKTDRIRNAGIGDKFFNHAMDMLSVAGFDGYFKVLNPAWSKTLGWSNQELLSKPWIEFVHPDDIEATNIMRSTIIVGEVLINFENRYRCKNGSYKWLSWTSYPSPNEKIMFGIARDITERKQFEATIKESEERLRVTMEVTNTAIWDWDLINDKWYASPLYYTMLGYEPVEGESDRSIWLQRIHPDDREFVKGKIMDVLSGEKAEYIYEARMIHADGTYRWHQVQGYVAATNQEGRATRMLGTRTDITERKQTEEAIRESEQLFSTIFFKSPVAISITSRDDGKIVEANETFLHDLEFSREDVIGKPIMELGIFYDPNYRQKLIEELIKTGAVMGFECPFKTKSGKILYGIVSMSSILYKGKPHQLTTVIDITDRKQAEIKIRYSERLLNESQRVSKIGSYTFDILSGYWEGSAYLNDMFGVDRSKPFSIEEWLGVIHPDDRKMMDEYLVMEVLEKKQCFDKKYQIINQINQQKIWVHGYGELEFDQSGNPVKMIGTIQDITDWEKTTEELIVAKEKAEQSDRLKSSFLANMSHEIRTPMNSIMGFASLLPEEGSKELVAKYANIIVQNSEQLVGLIDGIVLYSKLQTGLFSFRPACFEVQKLLDDIMQSFNLPMYQQQVTLKLASKPCKSAEIYSDYDKLRQIITNLITNAFKYTHKGEITLGCTPQENSHEFYVKDTGIGIPTKDIPYIFDRFYRGSNIDPSRMRGTGLGLCIVKELVEMLGGTIRVESNSDESNGEKGSCFYFSIPNKKHIKNENSIYG